MSLEISVLNDSRIADLLKKHYNLKIQGCTRLPLGSANCYRVYDAEKNYFLKEFQSSVSENAIEREAELLGFLSGADIPVSRFIPTNSGKWHFIFEGHAICLQEYIDGTTCGYDDFPTHLLPSLAQMLGRIHAALGDYSLPVSMGEKWLDSFSAEDLIGQYDALIRKAQTANNANSARIITDLTYKKTLALHCEQYKKIYEGITFVSTHGDYQGCQTIFTQTDIKAVIDFSSAAKLPAVWEIMRSYVQSSQQANRNADFDIDELCAYVKEYLKYGRLTKRDLHAMPYVYLFQLARSGFGYKQYLKGQSDEGEQLLQFGIWRTRMCRFLEENLVKISDKLLSEISL
jgi:Ser/Thr protein kinase RdoA (MazF antagonist)